MVNNQLNIRFVFGLKYLVLNLKTPGTDFEFNKPISKKGGRILKDFEKNSPDFEGFATLFESPRHLPEGTFPQISKWRNFAPSKFI